MFFYLAQLLHPPNGTSIVFPVLGLPNLRVGGRGGLNIKTEFQLNII